MNPNRPPETFPNRVEYAAICILNQTTRSREFDNCFEMYDGDVLVAALIRKAETQPELRTAIALWQSHGKSQELPDEWLQAAAKYCDVNNLTKRARQVRARRSKEARHTVDSLTQQNPSNPPDELGRGLQELAANISRARYYIALETETTSSGFYAKSKTRKGAESEAAAHLAQFPSWKTATVRPAHR